MLKIYFKKVVLNRYNLSNKIKKRHKNIKLLKILLLIINFSKNKCLKNKIEAMKNYLLVNQEIT
jgi:hypothetical protein